MHAVPAWPRHRPASQIAQLLLVFLTSIERIGPQGHGKCPAGVIDPSLDLRRAQVICPAGLGYRGLALNDLNDQRRFALGCSTLDAVFQWSTHRYLSPCSMSRLSLGRYKDFLLDNLNPNLIDLGSAAVLSEDRPADLVVHAGLAASIGAAKAAFAISALRMPQRS